MGAGCSVKPKPLKRGQQRSLSQTQPNSGREEIRRPPLGVCRVKPAVLLSCWCCTVVLLYCCTAVLCCIYTTVVVNRGQGLRTPTSALFPPSPAILAHPRSSSLKPLNSKKHTGILPLCIEIAIRRPPLGVCSVKGCCTAVSVVLLVYWSTVY